jgi:hypothetical protein
VPCYKPGNLLEANLYVRVLLIFSCLGLSSIQAVDYYKILEQNLNPIASARFVRPAVDQLLSVVPSQTLKADASRYLADPRSAGFGLEAAAEVLVRIAEKEGDKELFILTHRSPIASDRDLLLSNKAISQVRRRLAESKRPVDFYLSFSEGNRRSLAELILTSVKNDSNLEILEAARAVLQLGSSQQIYDILKGFRTDQNYAERAWAIASVSLQEKLFGGHVLVDFLSAPNPDADRGLFYYQRAAYFRTVQILFDGGERKSYLVALSPVIKRSVLEGMVRAASSRSQAEMDLLAVVLMRLDSIPQIISWLRHHPYFRENNGTQLANFIERFHPDGPITCQLRTASLDEYFPAIRLD